MKKEHKYFEILNSFIDSIAILNQKGEIVFTNVSWKNFSIKNFGHPEKTGLGVNYLDTCKNVIGNEIENGIVAFNGIRKVIKKEIAVFELEYPCHSVDEKRWFLLRATPLETDLSLTIVSHINITKRRVSEEEVRKTNTQIQTINERLKSTTYKIVHDIQSPLNSIEGLINLTKLENKKADINTHFELISKSITNLKMYIQDTLKISSLGLIYDSLDFKLLMDDFIQSIQHNENMKMLHIELNVDQECDFYSDKNELYSIVSNVVSNCLKFFDIKKTQPFIIINVQVNSNEAIITIQDNGIGIKKDDQNEIFEQNFQSDKKAKTGAGLGLYMVKKSVEWLNGTINIISDYGIGTTFIFKIPNHKK